jgi:hypothetical protein
VSIGVIVALITLQINLVSCQGTEEEARLYLETLESRYSSACNDQITTRWAYITNVTDETADASTSADTAFLEFQASIQREILANFSNWQNFTDPQIRREFKYLAIKGPATMPPEDVSDVCMPYLIYNLIFLN